MQSPLNLPLARAALDRNSEIRSDAGLLGRLLESSNTFAVLVSGDKVLANSQGSGLRLLPILALTELGLSQPMAYLGETIADESGVATGSAILAFDLDEKQLAVLNASEHADATDWLQLRRSGHGLSDRDAGLVSQALALANWHRAHGFCSNCGQPNEPTQAGWSRTCGECATQVFPRNDPAIIVVITDDEDRILLGSQGAWESNRWSILAGFVDAGETLDAAVTREMLEESGLRVSELKFVGSQPWPYPHSIMLGFTARARGEQHLRPDGNEIAKLRWFSRQELRIESAEMLLPGKSTISRAMIEHWMGEPLHDSTEVAK